MRKIIAVVTAVAAVAICVACSAKADEPADQVTSGSTPSGFTGGCLDGYTVYVQGQFDPLGAVVRTDISIPANGKLSVPAGRELRAVGWFDTGKVIYPENPSVIQGQYWHYVPTVGWIADAALRSEQVAYAGDNDSAFTPDQAVPRNSTCELRRK